MKDENDFMNRFDEISNGFEKSDPIDVTEELLDENDLAESAGDEKPFAETGRLERLNSTRNKGEARLQEAIRLLNQQLPLGKNKTNPKPGVNMTKKRKRKKRYHVNVKRLILIALLLVLSVAVAIGFWVLSILQDTPKIDADNIYSLLSENSVIYDDAGNHIENIFAAGAGLRTNLDFTQMPADLINSFVAIEDKTFWDHKGFNITRIFGAVLDGFTSGDSIKGTSTITQQLARNLYLEDTKSLRSMERKIKEAYYAVQLESQLSKEQIVEAYLNTIYLGSGANGVQAAAQTYFSKDVAELTLGECSVLASVPKSPTQFSPIRRLDNVNITDPESLDFLYRGETFSIWYQSDYIDRQHLVLQFMKEQGYIDDSQYEEAIAEDIRAALKPNVETSEEITSYFADYVVEQVVQDLMFEYDIEEEIAKNMIYNGGLRIHSTMNVKIQKLVEAEFAKGANFPGVTGLNRDKDGNSRDASGNIQLYAYANIFDESNNFNLRPDEFKLNEDGSIIIYKGKRLNIFKTEVKGVVDYSVELKPLFQVEEGVFYGIAGGYLLIPSEYKSRDEEGNLILSKEFLQEKNIFQLSEGEIVIAKANFQLKERVIQPQAAMVILDYKSGGIKAMAGGRSLIGKLLFNRSISPRQPGSAIKPLAVYGPALQRSVDMVANNATDTGTLWTAASIIDDAPYIVNDKLWPKNWYNGYRGLYTLRQSVEQSVNVNAVQVLTDIGPSTSLAFLKKLGVTSVVESGNINDMNAAALSLGGMTKGISPLQMAGGFSTFANQGIYIEPVPYTTVTNKMGEILLERSPKKEQVMDRGVAFLMTDILQTTVTNGIAGSAAIGSSPVAGKTGTTTDNYDAWFVGMTPHYAAALWIGNDMSLELTQGSVAAARLWGKIMKQVHVGLPAGSFPTADNIVTAAIDTKSGKLPSELSALDPRGTIRNEYFVSGTQPVEIDDVHVYATICPDSLDLATPYCPNPITKVMTQRPPGSITTYGDFKVGDIDYEKPVYYCNLHNPDAFSYPIDPLKTLVDTFLYPYPIPPGYEDPPPGYEDPSTDDEKPNNGKPKDNNP